MFREKFSGYVMIAFLIFAVVSAVFDVWQTRGDAVAAGPEKIITGQWASAYEQEFNKAVSIHEPSINIWDALNYTLYRDGREGVLVGANDWLFTTEEFDYFPDAKAEFRRKVAYIEDVRSVLAEHGSALVIALLPAKARVYGDRLGDYHYPSYKKDEYGRFLRELESRGFVVVDLLTAMRRHKDESDLFLRTDTHWTPDGARLAAERIASVVERRFGDLDPGRTTVFRTVRKETILHDGDLLRYIALGPLAGEIGPRPDRLAVMETREVRNGGTAEGDLEGALFGDAEIPVALVGTSYSANPLWNFAGFLKEELQADVLNAAEEGQGPFVTMQKYLADEAFQSTPPKLVIWEIPERTIPVSYEPGI